MRSSFNFWGIWCKNPSRTAEMNHWRHRILRLRASPRAILLRFADFNQASVQDFNQFEEFAVQMRVPLRRATSNPLATEMTRFWYLLQLRAISMSHERDSSSVRLNTIPSRESNRSYSYDHGTSHFNFKSAAELNPTKSVRTQPFGILAICMALGACSRIGR
jgi:hypothetical protein